MGPGAREAAGTGTRAGTAASRARVPAGTAGMGSGGEPGPYLTYPILPYGPHTPKYVLTGPKYVLTRLSKICPRRIVQNMSSLDCPKYVLTG